MSQQDDDGRVRVFLFGKELGPEEARAVFISLGYDFIRTIQAFINPQIPQLATGTLYAAALISKIVGRPEMMNKEVFLQHCGEAFDNVDEFFKSDEELANELRSIHIELLQAEKANAH